MQKSSKPDHIAVIYRFCAQSMHYPEPNWFTEKYINSLNTLLEALGDNTEKQRLTDILTRSSNKLEDLQVEHTRLFINGVPHVAAPPYGSVYLEKTLRGRYSEEILAFYHSSGYTLKEKADLPDNLIHQLEFLSFLAEDNNREREEEFLSRFFLPWFPIFAARVLEQAQHPFYRIIVRIIDFFTKEEEEYDVQLNEA